MARRKKVEVEVLDFSSVQEAQATKTKCIQKLEKYPLARLIAIAASVCGVIGGLGMLSGGGAFLSMLGSIGVMGAIATYVLIGGFGIGVKCAWKIAVVGWYIVPFPVDLFVVVFTFIFGVYALLFIPIIVLRSIKKQLQADLHDAEEYLANHAA